MANILVFLLDLKTTMAFEGLSLGLFKFAECKDDAWIGQQANSRLTKPVEPFHTENASVWNTGNKRVNSKAGMILGNTGILQKPTTSLFQICWHMFKAPARQLGIFMPRALQGLPVVGRAKRWHGALDGGFELLVSQKEILEKFINLMDSALRKTKIPDQERHQNLLPDGESHSFCQLHPLAITFCIGTKAESQPKTHVHTCTYMYSIAGIAFKIRLTWRWHAKWQRLGIQAWSPAQTCYLAPGSKDSTEHVQYQLLGRWKELQTHVLLLAIAPTRTTSTQTLLHSWQEDNVGPPWARNHFTSWTDTTGIAGLRYRTFETCWYEVP